MANLTPRDVEAIQTELKYREARTSYYKYVQLANRGYIPSRLHEFLCTAIQNFMEKPTPSSSFDVLLLSLPPQHGKSLTVTESLPSWYAGLHPDKDVIIISYSDDTASRFGRSNRAKLEEFSQPPFDVVAPLFNNYRMGDVWNNTDICNQFGKYIRSRGIMSGITSNPADLIIIDDPLKTMQEARSDTTKEVIWREYLSSIRTRIKPHGKLIVIATRWVEDDLIGRLLSSISNRRLTTIFLPCECVDEEGDPLGRKKGEALCPEIGRGDDWLAEFKAEYTDAEGLYTWSALYQCDPTPIAGAIVDPAWWKFYDYEEDLPFSSTYLSVDCSFKGNDKNDWVVIQTWSMVDDRYYLRAQDRDHYTFTEMLDAIREMIERFPDYIGILIEDKANGSAAIDTLSKEYNGIIPVTPAGGKESRMHAASKPIRQGRVYIPRGALWTQSYIREFTSFPNGKHDDQVDTTSQVLNYMLYAKGDEKSSADIVKSATIKIREWTSDIYEDYYRANPADRERIVKQYGYPKYGFYEEDN